MGEEAENAEIERMIKEDLGGCLEKTFMNQAAIDMLEMTMEKGYCKEFWEIFRDQLFDKLRPIASKTISER